MTPRKTRREVRVLDLVDDAALIAEYRARHAPGAVWPAVVRDIRARGIRSMEIWHCADRLVMIAEIADEPDSAPPPPPPEIARWEAEMDRYQRPLDSAGEKWAAMERIFSLVDQPDIDAG